MYPRWRSTKGRGSIIYVFLHSTFGPIMFLLFLCMRLSEFQFLMLSAMCPQWDDLRDCMFYRHSRNGSSDNLPLPSWEKGGRETRRFRLSGGTAQVKLRIAPVGRSTTMTGGWKLRQGKYLITCKRPRLSTQADLNKIWQQSVALAPYEQGFKMSYRKLSRERVSRM